MAKIRRRDHPIVSNPSQAAYIKTPIHIKGVLGIIGNIIPASPPSMTSNEMIKIVMWYASIIKQPEQARTKQGINKLQFSNNKI